MPVVTLPSVLDWKNQNPSYSESNQRIGTLLNSTYKTKNIYARLDALIELYETCRLDRNNVNAKKLAEKAGIFISAIVNAADETDLQKKIVSRKKLKKIDPHYMPWNSPNIVSQADKFSERSNYVSSLFPAISKQLAAKKIIKPIDGAIEIDHENDVSYFDLENREQYRLLIHDKKFKQITESKEGSNLLLSNFDTSLLDTSNEAIFIISHKGDFFALPSSNQKLHHTSAMAGSPVFFPGIVTITNGNLQKLANNSGHYLPPSLQLIRTMNFLRETGVLDKKNSGKIWQSNLRALREVSNSPQYRLMDLDINNLNSSLEKKSESIQSALFNAVKNDNLQALESIINRVDLSEVDDFERTALSHAIMEGYAEIIKLLLEHSSKEVINKPDVSGVTALIYAISANNTNLVEELLEKGADPNAATHDGLTPLALAAWLNSKNIFLLLLSKGADPKINSEQIFSFALQQNAHDIIIKMANPTYGINFNNSIENSLNTSNYNSALLLLVNLAQEVSLSEPVSTSLTDEKMNLMGEFVSLIDDAPEPMKQKWISETLGKKNAFGNLLNENDIQLLSDRLNRNSYKEQVDKFKSTPPQEYKRISPKHDPGSARIFSRHRRHQSQVINVHKKQLKQRTLK